MGLDFIKILRVLHWNDCGGVWKNRKDLQFYYFLVYSSYFLNVDDLILVYRFRSVNRYYYI